MLTAFSTIQQDLIIGTLLGDGHLGTRSNGVTWRYMAVHGASQKDYLFYKFQILKNFCLMTTPALRINNLHLKEHISWRFTTRSLKEFAYFGNKFYVLNSLSQTRVKIVPHDISNFLTARALAFWFMDDGTLMRYWVNYKIKEPSYYLDSVLFCTDGFSLEDLILLKEALQKNFNLNATIMKRKKSNKTGEQQYRLRLSMQQARVLKTIIEPFMVKSMLYKLDF